jgi:hypothetical protein
MKVLDLLLESSRRVDELFMGGPKPAQWTQGTELGVPVWRTSFAFAINGSDARVAIELIGDQDQIMGRYMFKDNGLGINPDAKGFGVNFSVDDDMDVTSRLGPRAALLIGEVVSRCMHFWNQHGEFSYVVFTGAEGSRNKLYASLARRLASMAGAKLITKRDDFLIYLPGAAATADQDK